MKGDHDIKKAIKVGYDLHHPGKEDLVEGWLFGFSFPFWFLVSPVTVLFSQK